MNNFLLLTSPQCQNSDEQKPAHYYKVTISPDIRRVKCSIVPPGLFESGLWLTPPTLINMFSPRQKWRGVWMQPAEWVWVGLCVISSNHLISGCVRATETFSDQEKKPHRHVNYRLVVCGNSSFKACHVHHKILKQRLHLAAWISLFVLVLIYILNPVSSDWLFSFQMTSIWKKLNSDANDYRFYIWTDNTKDEGHSSQNNPTEASYCLMRGSYRCVCWPPRNSP